MKKEERVNMSHLHCLSLVFALLLPSGAGASAQESQRTALLYSKKNLNLDATITFTLENDRSGSAELVQVRCRTEGRFRESEIAPWQPIPGKTGEDLFIDARTWALLRRGPDGRMEGVPRFEAINIVLPLHQWMRDVDEEFQRRETLPTFGLDYTLVQEYRTVRREDLSGRSAFVVEETLFEEESGRLHEVRTHWIDAEHGIRLKRTVRRGGRIVNEERLIEWNAGPELDALKGRGDARR